MFSKSHPLYGAQLRTERIDKHLTEADTLVSFFARACEQNMLAQYQNNVVNPVCAAPELPPSLPLAVSDAIHNMRSALDFIVFELARHDSGVTQDGTQFIIEDVKSDPLDPKKGFDGRKKRHLRGLSPAHVAMIEILQPYNGVEWTKTLRDISNPDKHRHLALLHSSGLFSFTVDMVNVILSDVDEGSIDRRAKPNFQVDAGYAIRVTLNQTNDTPVLPLLRRLQAEVCGCVEAFKSEF